MLKFDVMREKLNIDVRKNVHENLPDNWDFLTIAWWLSGSYTRAPYILLAVMLELQHLLILCKGSSYPRTAERLPKLKKDYFALNYSKMILV